MAGFLEKLRGSDPEEIKRRSAQFEQKYGGGPKEEEAAAEEGDITNYVMPIQGLGRNVLRAVAQKGVKEGAKVLGKEAVKEAEKDAMKIGTSIFKQKRQPVEGPDYTNENIAFRPTTPPKQVGWEKYSLRDRLNK